MSDKLSQSVLKVDGIGEVYKFDFKNVTEAELWELRVNNELVRQIDRGQIRVYSPPKEFNQEVRIHNTCDLIWTSGYPFEDKQFRMDRTVYVFFINDSCYTLGYFNGNLHITKRTYHDVINPYPEKYQATMVLNKCDREYEKAYHIDDINVFINLLDKTYFISNMMHSLMGSTIYNRAFGTIKNFSSDEEKQELLLEMAHQEIIEELKGTNIVDEIPDLEKLDGIIPKPGDTPRERKN